MDVVHEYGPISTNSPEDNAGDALGDAVEVLGSNVVVVESEARASNLAGPAVELELVELDEDALDVVGDSIVVPSSTGHKLHNCRVASQ